jgi:membrane peptidoglycan carboxypeptidase
MGGRETFRKDSVIDLMYEKKWIPSRDSTSLLDEAIQEAEQESYVRKDVGDMEDFVSLVNEMYVQLFDSTIKDWFEKNGDDA